MSSSVLAQYKALQMQIADKQDEVEKLLNNEAVQRVLEFEALLSEAMSEYQMSVADVVQILAPGAQLVEPKPVRTRAPRPVKVYTNPHSGEVVKTKGRSKVVSSWKQRYGDEAVESWMQIQPA